MTDSLNEVDQNTSGGVEGYSAPQWRPMPPEKGIYVLSRPHNEYLVTVSIQHVDNVEDRDGWLYYGPIPQPEAESAV